MNDIEKMKNVFISKTIDSAIEGFTIENNDEITNGVREFLDSLPEEELISIQNFLRTLLNYCYEGKLYPEELNEDDLNKIRSLNKRDLFLLKESIIYFYGRLLINSDIAMLQKIYNIDESKYIKLNIAYASLQTFQDSIELDFVDKILSSEEYDLLIRSWALAYYKATPNPYEYVDDGTVDWSPVKEVRLGRLSINEEDNPKFKKALLFRLLDLVLIYIFIKSRKENTLTDAERQIIENVRIDYDAYSKVKKEKLAQVKKLILEYKN